MFNLEEKISDWRKQMLAAGIETPVPLDELETHLREEIAQMLRSGSDGSEAFQSAVQKIGRGNMLKAEFKKVGASLETRFVKLLGIACGVVAGLFSLWILLVLLTAHEANSAERLLGLTAVALIILSARCGDKYLPIIQRPWVRAMAGALCCLASLGGMGVFLNFMVPHFLGLRAGAGFPVGWMLVAFLWTWTGIAILGGTAYGLEKAARKNIEQYV
jgi:hypothetical protein